MEPEAFRQRFRRLTAEIEAIDAAREEAVRAHDHSQQAALIDQEHMLLAQVQALIAAGELDEHPTNSRGGPAPAVNVISPDERAKLDYRHKKKRVEILLDKGVFALLVAVATIGFGFWANQKLESFKREQNEILANHEHNFQQTQRELARDEARTGEKIRQQSKFASLIVTASNLRWSIAVNKLFSSIQLRFVLKGSENYKKSFDEAITQQRDLDEKFNSINAELFATLAAAQVYFGLAVRRQMQEFVSYHGSSLYIDVPNFQETVKTIEKLQNDGMTEYEAIEEVQRSLLSAVKKDKWVDLGVLIVCRMAEETARDLGVPVNAIGTCKPDQMPTPTR